MKKILFIGNSFTFANELDVKVREMAASAGIAVESARVAKGGYHLYQYANPQSEDGIWARRELESQKWDYVVLQDHSLGPILEKDQFLAASATLCSLIRQVGAQPVFYQTWAYRPGSEKLRSTGMDYETMHTMLQQAYAQAATANEALCVPVGEAFRIQLKRGGADPLWSVDDYHPCLAGTYLASAVFCLALLPGMKPTAYCPTGNELLTPADAVQLWDAALTAMKKP